MNSIKFVFALLLSMGSLNITAQEFSKCKFRQALQLYTSATGAGMVSWMKPGYITYLKMNIGLNWIMKASEKGNNS
ncbi:MAG: hypothetical protein SH818_18590 [Saprospiraceae bacterium]|nr:hypothetical protein [Saprospiraceae bacterium]